MPFIKMPSIYELNEEELVGDDWNDSAQQTLLIWGEIASQRAVLHDKAAGKAKIARDLIVFPIIFFASLTTVIIAFSDISDNSLFMYGALACSGFTAFLTGVNTHINPHEKFIRHTSAGNEYRGLVRDIDSVTSLHPKKRPDVEVPFTALTNRFDNIARLAPFLPQPPEESIKRDPKFFD